MNLRAVVPAQGGHDGRLGAASRRDPGGEHENEDPEPSGRGDAAAQSSRRCRLTSRGQPALSTWPQEIGGPAPASCGRRAKLRSIASRRAGAGTYDRPRVQAAPGSAAEVRHGEQVEQRGAERDAE